MPDGFTSAPSRLRGDRVEPASWLGWRTSYRVLVDAFDERTARLRSRLGSSPVAELSREQRRALAEAALRVVPELSNRRVAALAGLTHPTVASLRAEIYHSSPLGNGSVKPNAGNAGGGHVHTRAMASVLIERERETAPASVAATSRPAGSSPCQRRDGSAAAVYASTDAEPEPHFVGWLADLDVEALFAAGEVYGVTVRRRAL